MTAVTGQERSWAPRLRRLSIGVGAWLFACGTERVELDPGYGALHSESGEPLAASAESGATPPAVAPAINAPSVAPSDSSEDAARTLPLSATPGSQNGDLPPARAAGARRKGCGKVDLLFVVDNSLSMRDRQTALALSFPGFIRGVQKTLGSSDFHIMVVDTDGRSLSELARDALVADDESCEGTRGAGKRLSETGASCNFATAQRYLVQEQPELEQAFACVAQVGIDGSDLEHPIDAMLDALSPTLNGAGGCNEGFLRDDALLFITLISDEDDTHSEGDPADWQSQVLARKGNNSGAVVTLGIVADGNLSGGTCRALQDAPRLQSFAKSLGLMGSVCADDYSALFQQAAGWIAARCSEFVPSPR